MYLEQADADIKVSKSLFTPIGNPTNDEGITRIGLYLAQQGIELAGGDHEKALFQPPRHPLEYEGVATQKLIALRNAHKELSLS